MKRELSINEAARKTGISRQVIQKAVLLGKIEHRVETSECLKSRYLLDSKSLKEFEESYERREIKSDADHPLFDFKSKKRNIKNEESDVISSKIRRKLEVLREAKESGLSLADLY